MVKLDDINKTLILYKNLSNNSVVLKLNFKENIIQTIKRLTNNTNHKYWTEKEVKVINVYLYKIYKQIHRINSNNFDNIQIEINYLEELVKFNTNDGLCYMVDKNSIDNFEIEHIFNIEKLRGDF